MSLILEALRKSEAERRRGLPPDLHAELPPMPVERARVASAVWWAIAACAIVAFVTWWWLRTPGASQDAVSTSAAPGTADAPVPAVTGSDSAPLPAPTPSPEAAALPGPPPAAPAPVPATTGPIPVAPASTVRIGPGTPPSPAAQPPPADAVVPVPPAADARPDPGRPLSLSELDPGARDALPPLRMSMHLWNETPALRFAIIDGQRVTEGDSVGDARIARIERDGVLLEWQGRTIQLPVR